ncbi:MAG: DUF4255 domain-containing protein [Bacteroidota bacterium]
MISHALTIVINELNQHLEVYKLPGSPAAKAELGNIAEGFTTGSNLRELLILTLVNIREEKALKNLPSYVRNEVKLSASYENPPVFLNFQILLTATHTNYTNALLLLSRSIRFFQFQNVFTQDNVKPGSLTTNLPPNPLDQLESFKLIFDLFSPTMEEVNHLWGTLGGKQYPFVLYTLRMLDLKYRAVQSERGLITEVASEFYHKQPLAN